MEGRYISLILKNIFSASIGMLSQMILGFAGLIIAVRVLTKDEFGVFALIQVIVTFFVVISGLFLQDVSVTRFIARSSEEKKSQIANTAICCKLIICVGLAIVILVCKPVIQFAFKSNELSSYIVFISLIFVFWALDDFLLMVLQGFQQFKKIAIAQTLNAVIRLLLIIAFLLGLGIRTNGLVYAFLLSFVVSITYQYFSLPIRRRLNLNWKLFRVMLRFGFPLGLNHVLTLFFTKIDRVIIGTIMGPIGVASYEIASRIPDNFYRLFQSFNSVFFPHMSELFAKNSYQDAESLINNSLRLIAFTASLGAFLTMLFQDDIVKAIFSERYLDSGPVLTVLMVGIGIILVEYAIGATLVASGQPDKPVKINVINAVVNIVGNLIMIPIFGLLGAAYSVILGRLVTNPILVLFLRRSGIHLDTKQYLQPIFVFGCGAIIFLGSGITGMLFKILLVILTVGLCIKLSVIKYNDFEHAFKAVKS
jgi:O-antigen/teichoic acid export membrane protein